MGRKARHRKFGTLRDFLHAVTSGKMTKEEAEGILDGIELGIGLKKRDREIAKTMEGAAPTYTEDPVYVDGFNTGVIAGYEAAREDQRNGLDILEGQPPQATISPEMQKAIDAARRGPVPLLSLADKTGEPN